MFIFGIAMFLLGMLVALIGVVKLHAGTLKVYIPNQQDDLPYLCVELEKPVGAICNRRYVLFDVSVQNLNTQK